ncbi:DNA-directed RNA polymerase subunit alpha [Candidatus Woesebacteria bacterium]|nr:DNA-directed RNA polymerase subunit alpha [Candidatus Woesebacteria bacterium]
MEDILFETITEKEKDGYAKFVITPLPQGYGVTLGNSLRRVLLSSLPGAVITTARISGVKHQFSSLKGMKEDVVELILNLKKVRFVYDGDKPVKASIKAEGPGEVLAKDIQVESTVKLVNPDQPIAVLSKDAKLSAKFEIESGIGYSPADDRATGEVGLIPLDASFSPITRVNYKVEETRVGRLTNYDKLTLEVWTDGSVTPKDALKKSSEILISYFKQIVNPKKVEKEEKEKEDGLGPEGKLSVEEISLPTRVANALVKAGYETVEDLVYAKKEDLVKVRNLGEKSVKIIEAALGEKDLEFKEE